MRKYVDTEPQPHGATNPSNHDNDKAMENATIGTREPAEPAQSLQHTNTKTTRRQYNKNTPRCIGEGAHVYAVRRCECDATACHIHQCVFRARCVCGPVHLHVRLHLHLHVHLRIHVQLHRRMRMCLRVHVQPTVHLPMNLPVHMHMCVKQQVMCNASPMCVRIGVCICMHVRLQVQPTAHVRVYRHVRVAARLCVRRSDDVRMCAYA
jgi:hypothetical protein